MGQKNGRRICIVVLLLVALAGVIWERAGEADAGTLMTHPAEIDSTNTISCAIQNVGTKPLTATLRAVILDNIHTILRNRPIQPGELVSILNTNQSEFSKLNWCQFDLTETPAQARATFCLLDTDLNCVREIAAR